MRRLALLARQALRRHGVEGDLTLLEHKKNTTFRVDGAAGSGTGRFVLRVCRPDLYGEREVRSELQWLDALARETDLGAPAPVALPGGELLGFESAPGVPEARICALFRWVPGRPLDAATLTPELAAAVGELLARLHRHADGLTPPPGFVRPRWSVDRLIGDGELLPPGAGEPLVTPADRELLDRAAERVRRDLGSLTEAAALQCLLHTDLEPDNTLSDGERLRPIDFGDCGWGHPLYDLAVSILPLAGRSGYPERYEALVRGYRSVRSLPPGEIELLDAFLVLRSLFSVRLIATQYWHDPVRRKAAETLFPYVFGELRRFCGASGGREPGAGDELAGLGVLELLDRLRGAGVRLWREGERLRFAAPRGALEGPLRAALAARKAEVLAFLESAQRAAVSDRLSEIPRVDAREAPLSFAQRRLWFFDRLEPDSPAYNVHAAFRLDGELRLGALAASLGAVMERHGSLRTTFGEREGEPVQWVHDPRPVPLPVVDLLRCAPATARTEALRLAQAEARRPFDLARGPVFRAGLLRLGPREHVLLLTMHHIVSDGWSVGVFFRELSSLYRGLAEGLTPRLPPLPIQYVDFAAWQARWLSGPVVDEQLAYWRRRLEGLPESLPLPTDRPPPARASHRGARCSRRLPRLLSEDLALLARRHDATPFMVLLAAFGALLARYTGETDLPVGSPIANRGRPETEGLIGFFVNSLVLRIDAGGGPGFAELLGRVREMTREAYSHQDLPFERLVEELRPDRMAARNPLFQVVFVLQNAPMGALGMAGLDLELLPADRGTAQFDLVCAAREEEDGLVLSLRSATDLFDASTGARLLGHLEWLLEGAVADPARPVAALPLLSRAERQQIEVEWADTRTDFPARSSVPALVAENAARRPAAVALSFRDEALSYGELVARSGRLAGRLRAAGIGAGSPVGLLAERSVEMVVGLLAILEAGGAYVPLDPDYPRERLELLLEEARPPVVLVQAGLDGVLSDLAPTAGSGPRPCALPLSDRVGKPAARAPAVPVDAGDPAYMFFTSGSTGRPKGVVVSHRGVVRLVRGVRYADLAGEETFLQISPIAFDASTFEVWGPLVNGGRLAILPPGLPTLEELGRRLARERVTTLFLTAGLFHQVAEVDPSMLAGVRRVFTGGDVVSPAHVRRAVEALGPGGRVYNAYGPTENATYTTTHAIAGADDLPPPGLTLPIGRPVSNDRVLVLAAGGRPVPVGVYGELYAAGAGVALGYHGMPRLTAERFLPDPSSPDPGGRSYRTGDLARWRQDGRLEFLGRADAQVKVRGFRIEPGEVEAALCEHPGVGEAAVGVAEGPDGGKRLVAWYVAAPDGAGASEAAVREHAAERLPRHMVPSVWVRLDRMPRTPHDKVDRRALPRPEIVAEAPAEAAPRTPLEEVLAGLWCEVLGLPSAGVHDGFFALGGHSLLATRLVSQVRAVCGVELPLRALFENPTVAGVAAWLGRRTEGEGRLALPPIEPLPGDGPYPVSFAQERMWFLDRLDPGSPVYAMPMSARIRGPLAPAVLARAFGALVLRHASLRTSFREGGGRPVQVVGEAGPVALPVIDLSVLPPGARSAEAERLLAQARRHRFDLARGPLLRLLLLRAGPGEHLLSLNVHHVVSDGWSMRVLTRELTAYHDAFAAGRRPDLDPLPIRYTDFAAWQRRCFTPEVLAGELAYWRETLAGAPEGRDLLGTGPRPPVQRFRGAVEPRSLDPELSSRLRAFCRREGATLFMVLLAALDVLLYRVSGEEDVVVGAPVAGRDRPELEGLIGLFLNTTALRVDLSGSPTYRTLLARVRETAFGAYAHQQVPFERVLAELAPRRDLARTPLFQVFLNVLSFPGAPAVEAGGAGSEGLSLEPVPAPGAPSKFDLTVYVAETADGVRIDWLYNADLFAPGRMRALADQLARVLAAMLERPDECVDRVSLVTDEAREVLPDPRAPLAQGWHGSVAERLDRWADEAPDRVAVTGDGEAVSYRELARLAAGVAGALHAAGVAPGQVVAVHACRAPALLAALLGTMRAGAVFLLLDAAHPPARLARCLRRADAAAWIEIAGAEAAPELAAGFPPARRLRLRLSGAIESAVAPGPAPGQEAAPAVEIGPADRAYVAFTSGTTGDPKGVAGAYGPLVHFLEWQRARFGLGADDRISALSGLSHDPLLRDLLAPVWAGGTAAVPAEPLRRDPEGLCAWLARQRVSVLHLTPSLGRLLTAAAPDRERLPAVRHAFFGGEPVDARTLGAFRSLAPAARLTGFYGTTETPQAPAWQPAEADSAGNGSRSDLALGRGIDGWQLFVVRRDGELAGIGERGEIAVRGPGLPAGYLGEEPGTRSGFRPSPWSGDADDRVFLTGDLGRFEPDGRVRGLGRRDHQVKVRGHRVEPGEVEAVLCAHAGVSGAAVVAWPDAAGDLSLVGYWAAAPGAAAGGPAEADLRAFLRDRLPEALVPPRLVRLDRLPTTPEGKLDRAALPAPEEIAGTGCMPAVSVAPGDELERELLDLWRELLPGRELSVDADFFQAGGHSLLTVVLAGRIERRLGRRLPVATFFQAPTVARLAAVLRAPAEDGNGRRALVELRPGAAGVAAAPWVLLHPVGGNVLCYRELVHRLDPQRSVLGLQTPDPPPEADVGTMAELYLDALRAERPGPGPWHLAGWSMGGLVALEIARRLRRAGERVGALVLLDSRVPPAGAGATRAPSREEIEALLARDLAGIAGGDGAPEGLDSEVAQPLLAAFEANLRALRAYRPEPYEGRALLVATEGTARDTGGPDLGWGATISELACERLPGGHYDLLRPPRVEAVARILDAATARPEA